MSQYSNPASHLEQYQSRVKIDRDSITDGRNHQDMQFKTMNNVSDHYTLSQTVRKGLIDKEKLQININKYFRNLYDMKSE